MAHKDPHHHEDCSQHFPLGVIFCAQKTKPHLRAGKKICKTVNFEKVKKCTKMRCAFPPPAAARPPPGVQHEKKHALRHHAGLQQTGPTLGGGLLHRGDEGEVVAEGGP